MSLDAPLVKEKGEEEHEAAAFTLFSEDSVSSLRRIRGVCVPRGAVERKRVQGAGENRGK